MPRTGVARPRSRSARKKSPYPYWFYLPAFVVFFIFFLLPTFSSFYFSLTRWTLFDSEFIGLDNFKQFFEEPALTKGLTNTLIYAVTTSGLKVVLGMLLAVLLTSSVIGRAFMRSAVFFPVLVSTIGVGLTFTVLMEPDVGLINKALAAVGITGPRWLVDPKWALMSVAFVDVWKGVGLATVIYIAGIVSVPREYYDAAARRRSRPVRAVPLHHAAARLARHGDRDHPVADRRTAVVRPDLGDDPRRPRLHQRRHRLGDLQAVPGRLLRPLHRRQRCAVCAGDGDHPAALLVPAPPRGAAVRKLSPIFVIVIGVVFLVPFAFILLTAAKTQAEAGQLEFSLPADWVLIDNFRQAIEARDYMLVTAFINSTIITVASVAIMVVLAAMVAYVLQRRPSKWTRVADVLILSGLIIPPAVVPTVWVLQELSLFKTLQGMVLIEVAFGLSFSILLFRAFIATIPRELDEAATIDGARPLRVFFSVIFPLLKSVTITVIVVQSVTVFNDFVNPLYFLPGDENATVQLTLFNFQSQYATSYHLLFADILLITIPPLIMFMFFNRRIVDGLTAGAVKG